MGLLDLAAGFGGQKVQDFRLYHEVEVLQKQSEIILGNHQAICAELKKTNELLEKILSKSQGIEELSSSENEKILPEFQRFEELSNSESSVKAHFQSHNHN